MVSPLRRSVLDFLDEVTYFVEVTKDSFRLGQLLHSIQFIKSEGIECRLLVFGATDAAPDLFYLNRFHCIYLEGMESNFYLKRMSPFPDQPLKTFSTEMPLARATSSGLLS